jgi:calcineurin-like phosphoesterase family protein
MKDTLVIVAGDCGFGFERKGYYENIVKRNTKRVNESNNWFLFIRGNHDNPAYFDGKTFRHKRFTCIPDYSVVKANGHTILCVGGAISVDRQPRIDA